MADKDAGGRPMRRGATGNAPAKRKGKKRGKKRNPCAPCKPKKKGY